MTSDAWLLVSWIVVGAALLVVHVIVLFQVLRAEKLEWGYRVLALIPPFAPFMAWVEGRRLVPIVWVVLVVIYGALRAFG